VVPVRSAAGQAADVRMAESMDVKKLYIVPALIYMAMLVLVTAIWSLYALILVQEAGTWVLIPFVFLGAILNIERKKVGLTLHEFLVVDPVCIREAKMVWAPGNYDYKIEENKNRYSGNMRYIVLVRPGGKHGFTFIKEAYYIKEYSTDMQDTLLDLQIASKDAAKKVVRLIENEIRDAKSGLWRIETREKAVEEYRELFLS
jgi:hypothetical protein